MKRSFQLDKGEKESMERTEQGPKHSVIRRSFLTLVTGFRAILEDDYSFIEFFKGFICMIKEPFI